MLKCLHKGAIFDKPEEQYWSSILRYLFSMSARDCSIMITFCPIVNAMSTEIKAKLNHGEALVAIKGREYVAKVGVIDFDVKLIKKLEFYYSDKIRSLTEYIDFYSS